MVAASRRVRAGVAGAVAIASGTLHFVENRAYHSHLRHVDPAVARVSCLQTENGFYYSYYSGLVDAASVAQGLRDIIWDTRSEYPDTLNAFRRFNIYQEALLALVYRLLRTCGLALVDAWTFFRFVLSVHSSVGQVALALLTSEMSGNPIAGVACFLFSFLNRFQISRFGSYSSADLREHWGVPLLWVQIWLLWRLIVGASSGRRRPLLWTGFTCCTFMFIVSWQFSPFLLLLQATALYFICLVAGYGTIRGVVVGTINAYIIAMVAAFALHFGSPYLATSPFLAQLVALRIATALRSFCWQGARSGAESRGSWLGRRLLDVAEGLVAVVAFGCVLKAMAPFATADTHVYEILCSKAAVVNEWLPSSLRLPAERLPECTEPSFNARLYLVMGVFKEIEADSLKLYFATTVAQAAALACALVVVRCLLRPVLARAALAGSPRPAKEPPAAEPAAGEAVAAKAKQVEQESGGMRRRKGGKPELPSEPPRGPQRQRHDADLVLPPSADEAALVCEDAALLFFVVQFLLLLLLGFLVNRLRVAFGPPMMVLAASAAGPRLVAWWPGRRTQQVLVVAAVAVHLAHVAWAFGLLPCAGDEEGICGQMSEKKTSDGDLVDLMEWMNQNVRPNRPILASMNLAGTLRAFVGHPMVIHPQFESENLRKRVQRAYELYHCGTEESFAQTMLSLRAKVVVFELARCFFTPYTLDDRRKNCIKGKHQDEDQLCLKLHASQGRFKLLFTNGGYSVYRLLNKTAGEALPPAAVAESLSSPATWKSYVDRCAARQGDACGQRLVEAAATWHHGLRRPEVAQTLRSLALERFPQDGIVQYYMARYLDYDAKRSREAGQHYEAAAQMLPNNPYILREYLMWLDMEAKDKKRLQALLQRRGQKQLLDLDGTGAGELFCEAAASAQDLGLGDVSRDLWKRAREIAPLGKCVKNNWQLMERTEKYEDRYKPWSRFWAYMSASVTHETGSHHGPGVRFAEPRYYHLSPVLARDD